MEKSIACPGGAGSVSGESIMASMGLSNVGLFVKEWSSN